MRVIRIEEFGPPEVLAVHELPDPEPGPGEVLIEVEAAGVTFVETQVRAGRAPFAVSLPLVPGNGVAGTIAATGDGVDASLVGRRVVTSLGGSGGYADRVVVGAGQPHDLPDALGYEDAVALLADGRTAVMLVEAAGVQPGETALVEAAAGGVGTLLVQLLADAGAAVVAAAGGERKLALARELGAATAVDYRSPGWERAAGEVDVVFDGVGGETAAAAFTALRRGGRMLSYGLASGAWADIPEDAAAARDVTLLRPRAQPEQMRGWVQRALDLAGAGRLRPVIGQRFALQDAAEAHRAVASRATVGKTVLLTRG